MLVNILFPYCYQTRSIFVDLSLAMPVTLPALRKAMVEGGYRGYRLAGRWRPSPLGGGFTEIRFGEHKNQRLGRLGWGPVVKIGWMMLLEQLWCHVLTTYFENNKRNKDVYPMEKTIDNNTIYG